MTQARKRIPFSIKAGREVSSSGHHMHYSTLCLPVLLETGRGRAGWVSNSWSRGSTQAELREFAIDPYDAEDPVLRNDRSLSWK